MKSLIWLVLFGATIFIPDEFNRRALAITVFVLCTWVLWSQGGFIWWAGKTGLIIPASKRLADTAAETSARMKIPFREVLLMRIPVCKPAINPLLLTPPATMLWLMLIPCHALPKIVPLLVMLPTSLILPIQMPVL